MDDDSMSWLIERTNKNLTTSPENSKAINVLNAITNEYFVSTHKNTFANFIGSFQMVLDSVIKTNLSMKQVEKFVFVIISDMKFCIEFGHEKFYDKIKLLFQEAGLKSVFKTPFPMPHIIFWNVSNSIVDCLPCNINTPKIAFLSGYNSEYLRYFSRIGFDGSINTNSFDIIVKILNNPRYKFIEDLFANLVV